MRFNVLTDSDWESRVDQVLNEMSDLGYRRYFEERNYGPGLVAVTVVLMCQEPELNLKRRVRLAKKEKKLYLDVMLDLPQMKAADNAMRKRIVTERLSKEVPEVVSQYKISDFDAAGFISDLKAWIASTGWH